MKKNSFSFVGRKFSYAAAALVVAAAMQGCSDDPVTDEPLDSTPDTTGITVGNNPAEQAHRVTFYGKSAGRSSRAIEDFPTIGEMPAIPADAPVYATPNAAQQDWQNEARKTAYVLTGGDDQIELYGNTSVFITGNVTTHNLNGAGTVYVMPEGSLTLKGGNIQQATIVAYGQLSTTDQEVTIGRNGKILVNGNFVAKNNLAVEGYCVVKDNLTVGRKLQVSQGHIKAKCIDVVNEINISGGGEVAAESYMTTPILYLGWDAWTYLYPNAMADITEKTTLSSDHSYFVYCDPEQTGANALLRTEELHVEGGADNAAFVNGMFAHEMKVAYTTFTNCNPATFEDFLPSSTDYRIPAAGCNPGNATEDPEKPSFDQIAVIESPTHDHDYLSATCVQAAANGNAYVCYHLNEAYSDNADHAAVSLHQGCAEVFDVTEDHAQISSWLLNENFDFNHLIVDGDRMFTVGDMKAGGRMGVITLSNGHFGQQSAEMSIVNLNGTTGNCILRDGNSFRIATNNGFQSIDTQSFEDNSELLPTTGNAKHLAAGNGVIATLNLDQKGVTSSPATVNIYRNNWGDATATFAVSNITPTNGKNVIAVDDNYVYVCLGENGVEKYTLEGQLAGSYNWKNEHPNSKGRPCANGLAVDEKYIYVAYGGAGLYVLDKTTMTPAARYYHKDEVTNEAKYSANYVALVNGFIYIAYGRNGLEVIKMNTPAGV